MKSFNIGRDKYIHFAMCLVIAFVFTYFLKCLDTPTLAAILGGFGASMGTACGKELGDHLAPGNKWDWYDIIADALGAVIGSMSGFIPAFF